jgi:hypothetical protein
MTVGFDAPVSATIVPVPAPSAASSTILARSASSGRTEAELAHDVSTWRSRDGRFTGTVNDISRWSGQVTSLTHRRKTGFLARYD